MRKTWQIEALTIGGDGEMSAFVPGRKHILAAEAVVEAIGRRKPSQAKIAAVLAKHFPELPDGWVEEVGAKIRQRWGMLPVDEKRIVALIKQVAG